jgi:hypothetical protein
VPECRTEAAFHGSVQRGVTRAKQKVSRTTGIPLTKSGRQRKVGKIATGGGCLLPAVLLAMTAVLIASCGGASTPTQDAAPEPDPGLITRAEYGADWPFSVASGTLSCVPSGNNDGRLLVTFNTGDGIEYALNGSARTFGFPELDTSVMPDWPDGSSLGPIIERGLALCE